MNGTLRAVFRAHRSFDVNRKLPENQNDDQHY